MEPQAVLLEEHRHIADALDLLDRALAALAAGGEAPSPADLARVVSCLVEFLDEVHHGKEEEVLFPMLRQVWTAREVAPFRRLLADHLEEKERLFDLEDAVLAAPAWTEARRADVLERGRSYLAMARAHMRLEESVVFPMIGSHLSESQRADLRRSFDALASHPDAADVRAGIAALAAELGERFSGGPARG